MKTNPIYRRLIVANSSATGLFRKQLLGFIACAFFTLLPVLSSAQTSTDWALQKQEGDVKAYAKIGDCESEASQTFFIRFENTSATQTYEVVYELSVPNNPTFPPIAGRTTLSPGNSAEGSCSQPPLQGLRMPTPNGTYALNDLIIKYTLLTK